MCHARVKAQAAGDAGSIEIICEGGSASEAQACRIGFLCPSDLS
jgi:hypothetical protein